MKKIRIYNDIAVKWTITTNGKDESLEGRTLSVWLQNPLGARIPMSITVSGNVVSFTYTGKEQKMIGNYIAVAQETTDGVCRTIDHCCPFCLVPHTHQETDEDDDNISTDVVDLDGDLQSLKHGLSAYEIAVEHGFVGTEEEWLESLSYDSKQAAKVANAAAEEAQSAASAANEAAEKANDAATAANSAAADAMTATANAESATAAAKEATEGANKATDNANSATESATDAAKSANDAAVKAAEAAKNVKDGKSAYELAVESGYEGTEAEWLASLHGIDGDNGLGGKVDERETTGDVVLEMKPNLLYMYGELTSLTITLGTPEDETRVNEYMIQWVSGATATTLTLPESVVFMGLDTVTANKTYQLSILNNIAVMGGASNE